MKSPYVNELEPSKVITSSFLVHSKEIRQKKGGEMYLSLILADRTGEVDAKMFDNVAGVLDAFERDDFVRVKGLIEIFHNRRQLTIHKVRRMDESEIDYLDYFPCSRRDPDEMWNLLREIVSGIGNPHLKGLVEALLDDEEVSRRYRRAPAAKQIHHAYLGGLIEHVLSLCALARMTASHYPHVDLDLLLTGVVLHDVGKIYELNYERGFTYSDEGQLLGHIQIGLSMVAEKLRGLPDFPRPLRRLVEHMILSHHGRLEFGSPKLPQFPEALLLHYLDDLDSKMECMRALIERDRQVEGCFTGFSPALERMALKKERFLAPVPKPLPCGRGSGPAAAPDQSVNADQNANSDQSRDFEEAVLPIPPLTSAARPPLPVASPAAASHPLFSPRRDSPLAEPPKPAVEAATAQES